MDGFHSRLGFRDSRGVGLVYNCEIAGALPTRPDAGHWISNFFPITDSNGKVVQVGAVVVELGKDVQLQGTHNPSTSAVTLLRSWKDIARYVGTCVKTVQRWEEAHQFPIRRVQPKKGAVVFALRNEVDHWLLSRASPMRNNSVAPNAAL
jgi:hypothetical protein